MIKCPSLRMLMDSIKSSLFFPFFAAVPLSIEQAYSLQ